MFRFVSLDYSGSLMDTVFPCATVLVWLENLALITMFKHLLIHWSSEINCQYLLCINCFIHLTIKHFSLFLVSQTWGFIAFLCSSFTSRKFGNLPVYPDTLLINQIKKQYIYRWWKMSQPYYMIHYPKPSILLYLHNLTPVWIFQV